MKTLLAMILVYWVFGTLKPQGPYLATRPTTKV